MQFEDRKLALLVYLSILLAAITWTAGAVLWPVLEAHSIGGGALAFLIKSGYGRVCHQIASRSFWIDGHPMAVCARCIGIYSGYVIGLIAYPAARPIARTDTPARIWLILGLAPTTVDFFVGYIGLINNTAPSRFITGLIAGAVAVFYTLPGLVGMAGEVTRTRRFKNVRPLERKNG